MCFLFGTPSHFSWSEFCRPTPHLSSGHASNLPIRWLVVLVVSGELFIFVQSALELKWIVFLFELTLQVVRSAQCRLWSCISEMIFFDVCHVRFANLTRLR